MTTGHVSQTETTVPGHTVSGRFRRVPALSEAAAGWGIMSDTGKEKRCDRNGGHVLMVRDGQITCLNCPATWVDFGF